MELEIRTERPNLFEPCDGIVFLVQLRGAVQPGELLVPVRAVFAAHESTLCRIELCADGRALYRRQAQTGCTVQLACAAPCCVACNEMRNKLNSIYSTIK